MTRKEVLTAAVAGANRRPIEILVHIHSAAKGIAFIAHGFGGSIDEPTLVSIHTALAECGGYTTVRWNTSERRLYCTTATGFYRDMEAVIAWARRQSWCTGNQIVAGHSLGGMVAGTYAQRHPGGLYAAILVAPAVSEQALRHALGSEDFTTWLQRNLPPVFRRNRVLFELVVSYMSRDLRRYSLMQVTDAYTLPTLVIGGGLDDIVLPLQLHRFKEKLRAPHQELVFLPGLSHTIHPYDLPQVTKTIAAFMEELKDTKKPVE